MKHAPSIGILLVTAALAAAAPAAATTGTAEKSAGPAAAWLASGKSKEDAAAMRHVARYYPLELEFARKAAPLPRQSADIDVMVKDRSGRLVLRAKAEGDLMLANLPAGEYAVSATYNGIAILQNVTVARDQYRKLSFEWKS